MLKKIFGSDRNIVIGAIHLPPMPGYQGFPGIDAAIKNALLDLVAFESGGTTAAIFENNYDLPHTEFVSAQIYEAMKEVGISIKQRTNKPLGISVLWNDYKTALNIAGELGLPFVRIPVFVDKVKTNYGIIEGNANKITKYRDELKSGPVALFTDIHVKHAKLLSTYTLAESAKMAIDNGSDALIITGEWTGDPPSAITIETLRKSIGNFPIFVGSGLNADNARKLLSVANGAIVSTSLKEGYLDNNETNLTKYDQRISKNKVASLIKSLKREPDHL
jgi:uncharacterized protein